GQNVAGKNAKIIRAQSTGRFHIFFFSCGQHLRAYQPRITNPSAERKRKYQVENPRPTKGYKSNGDQNSGERQERIHQDHVDKAIYATSVVAGDRANDRSEEHTSELQSR